MTQNYKRSVLTGTVSDETTDIRAAQRLPHHMVGVLSVALLSNLEWGELITQLGITLPDALVLL